MTDPADRTAIAWWMIFLNVATMLVLAFKTWACFYNPAMIFGETANYEPAHVKALWELAGRNIAMIALGLYALARPSRGVYIAIFVVALLREGADMVFAAIAPPQSAQSLIQAASFLVFLVPYVFALRKLHA